MAIVAWHTRITYTDPVGTKTYYEGIASPYTTTKCLEEKPKKFDEENGAVGRQLLGFKPDYEQGYVKPVTVVEGSKAFDKGSCFAGVAGDINNLGSCYLMRKVRIQILLPTLC